MRPPPPPPPLTMGRGRKCAELRAGPARRRTQRNGRGLYRPVGVARSLNAPEMQIAALPRGGGGADQDGAHRDHQDERRSRLATDRARARAGGAQIAPPDRRSPVYFDQIRRLRAPGRLNLIMRYFKEIPRDGAGQPRAAASYQLSEINGARRWRPFCVAPRPRRRAAR